MARSLPLRANLEWLKKLSKERLDALRAGDPQVKLSQVQLELAREYGFPSWRKLKAHVEHVRDELNTLVPASARRQAATQSVAADDPQLAAFLTAVAEGQLGSVAELLKSRPELGTAVGPEGATALHVAAQHNDGRAAALLVAYGADLNATFGNSAHTPLSWAVTCNATDCARTLLKLGAETDLFCAAGVGALEHVQSFFGADGSLIEGASRTGSTRFAGDGTRLPCPPPTAGEQVADALYIACRNAHPEVVEYLLTRSPDLSFRAYLGGTALHWAYFGGSPRVVEMLLAAGADATPRDDTLHCLPRLFGICVAANWGLGFLVRARLSEDPSLANAMDGSTSALHEAARKNHPGIVRLLLDAGAQPELRDGAGKTPLDLATEQGHAQIVAMLRRVNSA